MPYLDPTAGAKRLVDVRVGLHVGQLFQRVPGGIGRVTEMLCAELPAYTQVVAFGAGSWRARRRLGPRVDAAAGSGGLEFRSLGPCAPRWRYAQWHRFRGHRLDFDVDVCHAPSLAVPPTVAPLVVTVNDLAFLRHPQMCTSHGVRFHERGLAITRREARAIIVPSEFTRDELIREGFDRSRIHCVPLGVRVPDARAVVQSCDESARHRAHRPYLLLPGTVEPRKDHATVLAAFERVRARYGISLVVAGAWGRPAREDTRRFARPGVVALGSVPDSTLDVLYDNAEIVLSASIYEGFGLTVLEGLAHGRPVVASDIPPHREILGATGRRFPPGDVDALAERLDEILGDPAAAADLGRAGRDRARAFDVAATVAGHVAVYERAVYGYV
jgi:glycosyltransferase involved in cell wall biosynthesis